MAATPDILMGDLLKTMRSSQIFSTESAPFEAKPDARIAVKVIDTRGNELMVVRTIGDAISKA